MSEKINYNNLLGGCELNNTERKRELWKFNSVISSSNNDITDEIINTKYPINFRLWTPEILNQKSKSTCVSNALAIMKQIQDYYDTSKSIKYSTSFIYLLRQEGQTKSDGMYLDVALDNMREKGIAPYSLMPDNLDVSEGAVIKFRTERDNPELFEEAKKHKIENYALAESNEQIKYSLFVKHSPVPIGINVYDNFNKATDNDGIVPLYNSTKNVFCGGHCMLIIGWTNISGIDYWVVQNSWGKEWGDNGFCYLNMNKFPINEKYIVFDIKDYPMNLTDVQGRWSEKAITYCVNSGIIKGFEDNTFRPTETLTREQFCSAIYNMIKIQ